MAEASACRDYLAQWPLGPQGYMLPVTRVAVILDLTRQAVQQQIARGHLLAARVGKTFLVPLGEVERWRPAKAVRPRADGAGRFAGHGGDRGGQTGIEG